MKLQSTRTRMLKAFQKNKKLNTIQLLSFGPGLSSRIHELRETYIIVAVYRQPGLWEYFYKGKRKEV